MRVRRRARRDGLLVDGAVVVVEGAAVVAGMVKHGLVGLEVVEGGGVAVGVQRETVGLLDWGNSFASLNINDIIDILH